MSGLTRIVGAAVAGVVIDSDSAADRRRSAMLWVEWNSGALLALERLEQAANLLQPMILALIGITPSQADVAATATWHELITDRWWGCSEPLARCLRQAGLADAMFSMIRLRTPAGVHGLGVYREPGSRSFSPEERNLVQVFHAECQSLLHAPPIDRDGESNGSDEDVDAVHALLSPRQRQTLALVLDGLSDKEIAERLGISRYTVNQYTKAIYRLYGVTSRTQLLARLLARPHAAHSLIVGTGIVSAVP